jgi:hypothetical protein
MAIQTNDVDVDYRGLAYITDRAGNGLHILEVYREKIGVPFSKIGGLGRRFSFQYFKIFTFNPGSLILNN